MRERESPSFIVRVVGERLIYCADLVNNSTFIASEVRKVEAAVEAWRLERLTPELAEKIRKAETWLVGVRVNNMETTSREVPIRLNFLKPVARV